jgi:hypothetical protein
MSIQDFSIPLQTIDRVKWYMGQLLTKKKLTHQTDDKGNSQTYSKPKTPNEDPDP